MTDHTHPMWAKLPHGDEINALLDALHTLTDSEARDMATAWDATPEAAWISAMVTASNAAWDAARDAKWGSVWGAAWDSARATARDSAQGAVRASARDAALVLVVADLVGQRGLTRDHLDILTGPARAVPRLAEIIDRALAVGTNSTQEA